MSEVGRDLRLAVRRLRKRPGFTVLALVTLSVGIGANVAIFSVVNGVLLRPLPYPEPDRLVTLGEMAATGDTFEVSYPNFRDWREASSSLESLVAMQTFEATLRGGESSERVQAAFASPELFSLLGQRPIVGRIFLAEENQPGADPVVLLGEQVWERQFGADPATVGRAVRINGFQVTVIGVMPRGSELTRDVSLWLPLESTANRQRSNRAVHTLLVLGRLSPGVSLDAAQRELSGVAARVHEAHAGEDPGHGVRVIGLQGLLVNEAQLALLALFGAVAFLLLITCTNIADLQLARAAGRQREMAVRSALGASRSRLVREQLVESLLLALAGGAAGVLLAVWGLEVLVRMASSFVPRVEEVSIDIAVLGFTLVISLATGVVFGLWPAWRASRTDLAHALRERASTAAGSRRRWERHALAALQLAISLVLLTGAGLMLKSLWRLQSTDPGFRAENLLTLTVSLSGSEYDEREEVVGFYDELRRRLSELPGVDAVSGVNALPVSGGDSNGELTIEGRPFNPGEAPGASFRRTLPGYFRTAGIPLLQGREFDERDGRGGEMVVLVGESMARRYFPDGDAVGARIKVGPAEFEPWLTIVGVVADVRNEGLAVDPGLATYEPHAQRPWMTMKMVVRTEAEPLAMADRVREEIRALGGDLPVYDVATMGDRITRSLAAPRYQASLLLAFAFAALLVAGTGLYGVIAYSTSQRAREFGVRVALGAQPRDILALVLKQGVVTLAVGTVAGLLAALALTRLIAGLLHQVDPLDPATYGLVSLLLVAIALAATYVPARRATAVEPMSVLKED